MYNFVDFVDFIFVLNFNHFNYQSSLDRHQVIITRTSFIQRLNSTNRHFKLTTGEIHYARQLNYATRHSPHTNLYNHVQIILDR